MFSNASLQIGLTIGENIHVLSASDRLPEKFSSIVHKIAEEFLASKQNKKRICSFYVIVDGTKVNVWFALSGHEEKQEARKHKNCSLGKKLEEMKLDGNNLHVEFIPYREQRSVLPGFSVQGEENEHALILRFMRDGAGAAASNNLIFIDKFNLAPNNSVFLALKNINELMKNQKLNEFYGRTRHLSEFYDLTNFIYDVFYAEKWETHSEKAESDAKQDGAKFYFARGNNFVFWKMKKSGSESQDFRTPDKDITVYEQCRRMLTTELGQSQFLKYKKGTNPKRYIKPVPDMKKKSPEPCKMM